jgi:DNA-binding GntR family transcriptional regulator
VVDAPKVVRAAAPLRMQVVQLLRDAIVVGDFKPGERLIEAPLCERFGVSRTVVREAIRQLESEGLVTLVANRGPVVTALSQADAIALYEVRAALEGLAGERFAQRATEAQKRRLDSALKQAARAFESGDGRLRLRAKDHFYDVLFEGAGNPIITSTLRGIHARVQLLRGLSMQAPGRADEALGELRAIVDAVMRGDSERARSACETHVNNAASTALSMLADDAVSQATS